MYIVGMQGTDIAWEDAMRLDLQDWKHVFREEYHKIPGWALWFRRR